MRLLRRLGSALLTVASFVACGATSSPAGSACEAAGGTCVSPGVNCGNRAPGGSLQDCNSVPVPGGLTYCLGFDAGASDAGESDVGVDADGVDAAAGDGAVGSSCRAAGGACSIPYPGCVAAPNAANDCGVTPPNPGGFTACCLVPADAGN
jgi:hypothetical protein